MRPGSIWLRPRSRCISLHITCKPCCRLGRGRHETLVAASADGELSIIELVVIATQPGAGDHRGRLAIGIGINPGAGSPAAAGRTRAPFGGCGWLYGPGVSS